MTDDPAHAMRQHRRWFLAALPVVVQTLIAATGFYLLHLWMGSVLNRWQRVKLPPGIGPETVPLWALPGPQWPGLWLLPALFVFGFFIWAIPRLAGQPWPAIARVALLAACFPVLSCAALLMRGANTAQASLELLQSPFVFGHYWRDSSFRGTPGQLLREYPRRMPGLTVHNSVHPPGGVLLFWAARQAFGNSPAVAAVLRFLLTACCVMPLYLFARQRHGERAAFYAAGLWLLSPAVLLHGGTSMEGIYALPIVGCLAVFGIGLHGESPVRWGLLAGMLLLIASLMTFSVALVAALLAAAAGLHWLVVRQHRIDGSGPPVTWPAVYSRRAQWEIGSGRSWSPLILLAVTGLVCIGGLALLYAFTGFDFAASLREAIRRDRDLLFWKKIATTPYRLMVGLGNLTAFLIGVGVATFCWWERGILGASGWGWNHRFARRRGLSDTSVSVTGPVGRDPYLPVLPLILLVFSFGGFYSLETERIWLFLTPLVAMPAGAALARRTEDESSPGLWYATAALLALQTILWQHLLQVGGAENWGFP